MFTPPEYRDLNSWGDTVFCIYIGIAGAIVVLGTIFAAWGMQ